MARSAGRSPPRCMPTRSGRWCRWHGTRPVTGHGALSHDSLERASQAFLASHPKIDPNSDQWKAQRQVIEQLGSGGRLGVAIGVAGAGKTTLMAPIVSAMRDDGRQVYGIARGWKQAVALRDSGVERKDTVAVSVFLSRGTAKGRIKLDSNSVVIIDELSQVGRGDMLRLMQLQQKHGFTMLAIGDPKQTRIHRGAGDRPVGGNPGRQGAADIDQRAPGHGEGAEIAGLFRGKVRGGDRHEVGGWHGRARRRRPRQDDRPDCDRMDDAHAADPTVVPTIGVAYQS